MNFPNSTFTAFLILVFGGLCQTPVFGSENENELERMRAIEAKIKTVVAKNMESCVAIADGIGFGSGVIISADGLILTAGHVMGSELKDREFEVIFPSGKSARARSVGKNLGVDAGMVQLLDPGPWPFVDLAESDAKIGDWTVSLGHSGGYELGRKPPVRTGRVLTIRGNQLVTDAVLIGGDSGGPLFNLDGKLVGIHSSIGDTIAENRHVKISAFRRDWDRMLAGNSWGELPKLASNSDSEKAERKSNNRTPSPVRKSPKLGVVVDRTAETAKVTEVRAGSPADRVGIKVGDIVKTFEGSPVRGPVHLIELVKAKAVGDSVALTVQRGTYQLNYQIILDVLSK